MTGFSVCGAGDVDGDKVKDFLLGAGGTTSLQGGTTNAGQVYVFLWTTEHNSSNGNLGIRFQPLHTHLITSPLS